MSSKKFDSNKKIFISCKSLASSAGKTTPLRALRREAIRTPQGTPTERNTDRESGTISDETNPLNIAFSKSALVTRIPGLSGSSYATRTPRNMSTAYNACFTPSSLYRTAKSSPAKLRSGNNSAAATPRSIKNSTVCSAAITSVNRAGCSGSDEPNTEISNMTVAVRVRPLNALECNRTSVSNIVQVNGKELTIQAGTTADHSAGLTHTFLYDHVFYSCNSDSRRFATQQKVFEETALPLIDTAFEGYNACLFAYGQTGSGKSYSMMGIDPLDELNNTFEASEAGIIPRFCHELFRRIELLKENLQVEVEVSYFEIYNEKIHDLLCASQVEALCTGSETPSQRVGLKVREHPIWGPYIVDLSMHSVNSYETLRNWLAVGNSQRATAATGMNDKSSRSHSIFNIVLNITEIDGSISASDSDSTASELMMRQSRRSKISLVDLAGSERISAAGTNGDRIREGVSINKSLLTLGKVIAALANAKKNVKNFVPYRDSVLTWLLRENLGGNSKTVMLATISPASVHIDETLSTLRYACQARTIVNRVKVNESPHDRIIRELRAEVDRLKSLRQDYERNQRLSANSNLQPRKIIFETAVDESEVEALRQQLAESEKELQRAQKTWMERLKEAEDQRKCENYLLKQKGLALELSNEQKQACLINLAADPMLSGTLFYVLPPGIVKIGRTRNAGNSNQPQIILDGALVAPTHCTIENKSSSLFITPDTEDYETYLNGSLLMQRAQLFHGDRLVIGKTHYFRISNPFCKKRNQTQTQLVDYQLAHSEILREQEEKLRRELAEEKRQALTQIEIERRANERNYKERLDMLELEQLKYKCNKEILETERQALEAKTANEQEPLPYTSNYKSTLLEDINRIMQQPSEESLQHTKCMVMAANQHCAKLGLELEFKTLQRQDEFGMPRMLIQIIDHRKAQRAEWPIARLGVWLDIVRDCKNAKDIFNSVDIEWKPIEMYGNESPNVSLNSSRHMLNLSNLQDAILRPVLRLPNVCSPLKVNSKKMLTYDSGPTSPSVATPEKENFAEIAALHVQRMETSALYLKRLCEKNQDVKENSKKKIKNIEAEKTIKNSVARLEVILQEMRSCLNQSNKPDNQQSPAYNK